MTDDTRRALRRAGQAAVLLLLAIAAYVGWREFLFLTDDAHISFRYISNSHLGWGYTWNPPPFRPVEGYTNFLWVVVLDLVWRVTGIEPPAAANPILLACSCGTLALTFLLALRLRLPPALAGARFALAAAVVAATLSNRTFLAWMSSGLETALFGFLCSAWLLALVEADRQPTPVRLGLASSTAALAALTRPDGLLLCAACGLAVLAHVRRLRWRGVTLALTPLLLVPAHLLWRHATYGEWLPNSYVAKHVAAWPEAGLRYALSFALEYGLVVWLVVVLAALVAVVRRVGVGGAARQIAGRPATALAVAALVAHAGYYALVIGGDHFEYRVYAHVVPLLWLSLLCCCGVLRLRRVAVWAALGVFLAASLPLPWVHYLRTRTITDRARAHMLVMPVADAIPWPLRGYARLFDEQQAWLIGHYIGLRHQDHKTCYETLVQRLPTRGQGSQLTWERRAVIAADSVGVLGWVLPQTAILDLHGLNDRTIARSPVSAGRRAHRMLGHDRTPPPGYVECFAPDMGFDGKRLVLGPRRPLPDDQVRRCERELGGD